MSTMQAGALELESENPTATTSGDVSTFARIKFPTPFPPGSNVIVVPMVQTFNGRDTPGLRIADVTRGGFKIRLNELVGSSGALAGGKHVKETVGWVAYSV